MARSFVKKLPILLFELVPSNLQPGAQKPVPLLADIYSTRRLLVDQQVARTEHDPGSQFTMSLSPRDEYLQTEVMTATPQRRQVMLLESALRDINAIRNHWQAGEEEKAGDALVHAQEIMGELIAGLNPEVDPELTKSVAQIYTFVFRCLVNAHLQHSVEKLADAERVLMTDRETWLMVCQQNPVVPAPKMPVAGSNSPVFAQDDFDGRSSSMPFIDA